jgi:tripartite-type tricarboxylate transporter receptor subunit TctC
MTTIAQQRKPVGPGAMQVAARTAFVLCWPFAVATTGIASRADAQPFPTRPVRFVVPQPPGGHSDILGRIVAERLAEILRQPVVVENRSGAGGTIAAETVARAAPDGYTLLFAGSNTLTLAPLLINDLRYRIQDFAPVGTIARVSYALAVHPRLPARNIAELVAYARAHPGELNYASTGMASTSNFIFELLKRTANIDIVQIPFKGSAMAANELVSGRIDMMFGDLASLRPLAERGAVRLIAVAGATRAPGLPDVATVFEQGYPQLAIEPWYGIVVPAATPQPAVAVLGEALRQTLRLPDVRARFDGLGFVPLEMMPEQLQALIDSEIVTYRALVERAEIDPRR